MKEVNIKAVEAYLDAIRQKDLNLAPFADELEFYDSIAGTGKGADNFRAFLAGFLPGVSDVRVLSHVCEAEFVVTHWEVDGVFGIIPILEKFRVRDGKIVESLAFYDPQPVLG